MQANNIQNQEMATSTEVKQNKKASGREVFPLLLKEVLKPLSSLFSLSDFSLFWL